MLATLSPPTLTLTELSSLPPPPPPPPPPRTARCAASALGDDGADGGDGDEEAATPPSEEHGSPRHTALQEEIQEEVAVESSWKRGERSNVVGRCV